MIEKTILVANNHLERIGGSETYTYTLIEELQKKGYNVEYFTFFKGYVSNKIEMDLGVKFMSKSKYDLILANHNTCINYLSKRGKIIQTCHGIFPKEEQPSPYADGYVSISKEVQNHLNSLGFQSKVVLNGINCERFRIHKPIREKLKTVLSLSQSEKANCKIESACKELSLDFEKFNKNKNPIWDIEKMINKADLVIGLGRSAYEAMACGRPVIIYDDREYFESYADGYMTPALVDKCVKNNCSGRFFKLKLSEEDLILELKKYNIQNGIELRNLALRKFNIEKQTKKILDYSDTLFKKENRLKLFLVSWYANHRMNNRKKRKSK